MRAKGGDTADIRRISIGFVMATAAYVVLAAATAMAGRGQAPLAPEVLFFLLIDFAIPWIDTVILTLISRDAPASLVSTILGVYYIGAAAGNFLTGWLGGFAEKMTMPAFWLMHAAISGAALLFLVLAGFKLTQLLRPSEAAALSGLGEEPSAA
jgi:POT family proton-dependent oligopeptide transporter